MTTTMRATTRHTKEVYSGRYIDYDDPRPEQISLDDIAHGLAYSCRFGGHTSRFYSVAEHAILVSSLVLEARPDDYVTAIHALHHDDHEAYLGDLPTPLKNHFGGAYDSLRDKVDEAIFDALGLPTKGLSTLAIHRADAEALRVEAHLLLPSKGNDEDWDPAWEKFGLHDEAEAIYERHPFTPGLMPYEAEQEFRRAHARLLRAVKPWLRG